MQTVKYLTKNYESPKKNTTDGNIQVIYLKNDLSFCFMREKKAGSDYNKLFDPFNDGLFIRLERKLGIGIPFYANGPLYLVQYFLGNSEVFK